MKNALKQIGRGTILLLFIILTASTSAQSPYVLKPDGTITVNGTSSLHDWTMIQETYKGTFTISTKGDTVTILNGAIVCNTEELKSESSMMDNKAYDALKSSKFPTITYKIVSSQILNTKNTNAVLNGELTIAGVTRSTKLHYNANKLPDNSIKVTGTADIKMSNFDIKPPTAVFGTIKTGDVIQIKYEVVLSIK